VWMLCSFMPCLLKQESLLHAGLVGWHGLSKCAMLCCVTPQLSRLCLQDMV